MLDCSAPLNSTNLSGRASCSCSCPLTVFYDRCLLLTLWFVFHYLLYLFSTKIKLLPCPARNMGAEKPANVRRLVKIDEGYQRTVAYRPVLGRVLRHIRSPAGTRNSHLGTEGGSPTHVLHGDMHTLWHARSKYRRRYQFRRAPRSYT